MRFQLLVAAVLAAAVPGAAVRAASRPPRESEPIPEKTRPPRPVAPAPAPAQPPAPKLPSAVFRFTLGDSQGEHANSFAVVTYDRNRDEVYVARGDTVTIYKDGFEVYGFEADPQIGALHGLAVLDEGDLILLNTEGKLYRCNYRGRLIASFPISGVPDTVGGFKADRIQYAGGRIYLAESPSMRVLVVDPAGKFVAYRDLRTLVSKEKRTQAEDYQLAGFSVDTDGTILFTLPMLSKAFVVAPSGEVRSFGAPGSRNGKFNIAGAISRDENGLLYVADVLRCVVILFDKDFTYLVEVGGRGYSPGRLIAPFSMAVGNNWLFVSQGAERGVAAYRIF